MSLCTLEKKWTGCSKSHYPMAVWKPRLDLSSKKSVVLGMDRCIMINLCDLLLHLKPSPARSEREISSKPSFHISWHGRHPGFGNMWQQNFKGLRPFVDAGSALTKPLYMSQRRNMLFTQTTPFFVCLGFFLLHALHIISCYMAAKQSSFNIYLLKMWLAGFERAGGKTDEITGKSRNWLSFFRRLQQK